MATTADGVERKVYFHTLGCQMNEYDTGKMRALLAKDGYTPTSDPADADLVLRPAGGEAAAQLRASREVVPEIVVNSQLAAELSSDENRIVRRLPDEIAVPVLDPGFQG